MHSHSFDNWPNMDTHWYATDPPRFENFINVTITNWCRCPLSVSWCYAAVGQLNTHRQKMLWAWKRRFPFVGWYATVMFCSMYETILSIRCSNAVWWGQVVPTCPVCRCIQSFITTNRVAVREHFVLTVQCQGRLHRRSWRSTWSFSHVVVCHANMVQWLFPRVTVSGVADCHVAQSRVGFTVSIRIMN